MVVEFSPTNEHAALRHKSPLPIEVIVMKIKNKNRLAALALLALATINSQLATAQAQGTTAITYQGQLNSGAGNANGSYDMTFAVWDSNVAGRV